MSRTDPPPVRATRRLLVAATVALAVVAGACGSSSDSGDSADPEDTEDNTSGFNQLEPDDPPQDGGQLTVAVNAETDGWNPAVNQWADAGNIVGSTVMESLMTFDAEGVPQPYLAETVESNDDFTEWTITIPEGIEFHDGTVLDAQIVADNINFIAHGPTLAKVALDSIVGQAEAVDSTTIRVPLNSSWSAYPATLAGPSGYVMAPSMLDAANDYGVASPVGTGPFEFDSWTPDESFNVTRFENYRVDGEPHLDGIEFQVILDPGSRDSALTNGDVQMILTTSASSIDSFAEQDGFTVVADLDSEKSFIQLNTSKPPFDQKIAREAVARATDRQAVVEVVGAGVVTTTDDPFTGPWKVDDPGYVEFDLAEATALVEQYEAEFGPLEFRLSGLNNVGDRTLMDVLAEQWTAAGMDVTVQQVEQARYIGEAVGGEFQAQSFRGFAYADPDSDYVFWHSSTITPPISINFTQLSDPVIDDALESAREVSTIEERKPFYDTVARQLNSQFSHIWLFNTPYALIADSEVRGLNPARTIPFGNFLPKTWWGGVWLEQS